MVPAAWLRTAAAITVATTIFTAWVVGVSVSSASAGQPAVTLAVTGPAIHGDAPDPSILVIGHTEYAFTTGSGGDNVPVYESTDLVHWQLMGDVMPVLPSWAQVGYSWSPSVDVAPGGGYELFYDAYNDENGEQCIGRAIAPSPLGPFVDSSSTPFLCQQALGGSIDASVFRWHGGDILVWKSDRIAGIWAQRLGQGDASLAGVRHLLLTPTASWEDGVVEGPAILQIGSTMTLWFSAGTWSGPGYSIGMVVCASPLGPCDASSATQELKTGGTLIGPGSPTFFEGSGTVEMAFSAWDGDDRAMYLASVDVEGHALAADASPRSAAPGRPGTVRAVGAIGRRR